MKSYILIASVITAVIGEKYTTPVPILKQINKHNEDGSYSYGYEAADGTFKIETKYPNGEVFGKYGYVDDQGQSREVEYGASRRGFEPSGNEIQVPPPTLRTDSNAVVQPLAPNQEDDGQYREDPSVYYKNEGYNKPSYQQSYQQNQYQPRPQSKYQPQPQYQSQYQPQPQPQYQSHYQPQSQPAYTPQPAFRPQPTYNFPNSAPQYYNPAPPAYPGYNQFQGHPASNVDLYSGSYSVNYKR